ncbi:MAG TPA: class I SAM-dependent methyltransferase [Candidatus Saccharimonadales bacterium]|nr:class I SAM-dependent methyltransferase [Candidatus Saccharimonadales bacterium]
MTEKPKTSKRRADQYDDPDYNYRDYWQGREYENASEELAIARLLKGKKFKHAVDIGGGFGRLSLLLEDYAKKVTLAEPSAKQLKLASDYLKDHHNIEQMKLQADDLRFADDSIDLILMVRVMHHLPDPSSEFKELARILSPDGFLILELANYTHFRNRIKHSLKLKPFPKEPVSIRTNLKRSDDVAFVNHNPRTVIKQLSHEGLKVVKTLSVSNLRSPRLKAMLPVALMLRGEKILQPRLAWFYFGPSVFLLVKKAK